MHWWTNSAPGQDIVYTGSDSARRYFEVPYAIATLRRAHTLGKHLNARVAATSEHWPHSHDIGLHIGFQSDKTMRLEKCTLAVIGDMPVEKGSRFRNFPATTIQQRQIVDQILVALKPDR